VSTTKDIDAAEALSTWLRPLGLERYTPVFEENDIDLEALPLLAEIELETLGLSTSQECPVSSPDRWQRAKAAQRSLRVREKAERRQLTVLFCDPVAPPSSPAAWIEDYRAWCAQSPAEQGPVEVTSPSTGDGLRSWRKKR
jgi:hypothetical protein